MDLIEFRPLKKENPIGEARKGIFTTILAKKTPSNIEKLEFLKQLCYSIENEAQRCS